MAEAAAHSTAAPDAPPTQAARRGFTDKEDDAGVTTLELFFDLVFVFAITQVTALMATDPTARGLGQGMLVLGALWWAWVGYAWLTNRIQADEGLSRLVIFGAMAAMLIASLAVPKAFAGDATLFACAYAVVRGLQIVALNRSPSEASVRGAAARLAPTIAVSVVLLLIAASLDGAAQAGLWALALAVDFGGPLITRGRGWHVSPGHFAERHGLVVLIALGESIVAIGAASTTDLGAGEVLAAGLGVAIAAAQWWAYFDVVALVAERKLRSLEGVERNRMARDSYSYIHFLMIAGIVLLALGIKKTVAHVDEPLATVPAIALCGGAALYLIAHVLFRYRNLGSVNKQRVVVAAAMLALIPVATRVDALVALALLALLQCGLIAYEATRFAAARRRVRHGGTMEVSGR